MIQVQMYIPKYPMHPALHLRNRLIENLPGITEAPMCAGAWKNVQGECIQEGVCIITCLVEPEMLSIIDSILMQYKQDAQQEQVPYTVQEVQAIFL